MGIYEMAELGGSCNLFLVTIIEISFFGLSFSQLIILLWIRGLLPVINMWEHTGQAT